MTLTAPRRRTPTLLRPRLLGGAVLLVLLGLVAATTTVVRADDDTATTVGRPVFDAEGYAAERYDTEVVPAVQAEAQPVAELIAEIIEDPEAAGEAYGHRSGIASPYAYAVTGSGVAGAVDGNLLPVHVEGLPEGVELRLQVGPAINGTALRDATGLIGFGDFVNQIEYADVATELNNRVKEDVLADFDATAAEGSTVTFTGAFSYGSNTALLQVVPVELAVTP